MQNLFKFQMPFKFFKFIHWLWRSNIWRKRPLSLCLKKTTKKQQKNKGMIDNQGNYLEQLRIMLPHLMCFLEFRRVFCARCYISKARR